MSHPTTELLIPRSRILDLGDYERQRDEIRPSAMAARNLRRVAVGPNATLAFENVETLAYQVNEMLRAERIANDPEVRHEIETYSELLPTTNSLSGTLLIEFPEPKERAVRLAEMLGLEEHLSVEIEGAGASRAEFDQRQQDEVRLSSVQFVRFRLDDSQRDRILSGAGLKIACDHPAYSHTVDVDPSTASALADDLRAAAEMGA